MRERKYERKGDKNFFKIDQSVGCHKNGSTSTNEMDCFTFYDEVDSIVQFVFCEYV